MREIHLFSGAGGGILGGLLLGHTTVCAVEIEDYPRRVQLRRQADGILPKFPIWDDIRTFPAKDWRGQCDILAGGFPCQDISAAGKGAGLDGARSGLWREFARCVCEIEPPWVYVENSPMLVSRGLSRVLRDLAALGYDAEWTCLSAGECGAPHERNRIWILARRQDSNDNCLRKLQQKGRVKEQRRWIGDVCQEVPNSNKTQSEGGGISSGIYKEDSNTIFDSWWSAEPRMDRVANGVANWMDRIGAIGNGQVPIVAARAFLELMRRFDKLP